MQEHPGGRAAAGQEARRDAPAGGHRARTRAALPSGPFSLRAGPRTTAIGTISAIVAPMLPAIEAGEIVGAHDPDEGDAGAAALQPQMVS